MQTQTEQPIFSEAIQRAIDIRREKVGCLRGHYEAQERTLDAIGSKLNRAKRKQRSLEQLQINYQQMECQKKDMEEVFGGKLDYFMDLFPKHFEDKFKALMKEMIRTRYFRETYVYNEGERGLICAYIQISQQKIATRKMTQEEYEFLMKNKPRKIIKQLVR